MDMSKLYCYCEDKHPSPASFRLYQNSAATIHLQQRTLMLCTFFVARFLMLSNDIFDVKSLTSGLIFHHASIPDKGYPVRPITSITSTMVAGNGIARILSIASANSCPTVASLSDIVSMFQEVPTARKPCSVKRIAPWYDPSPPITTQLTFVMFVSTLLDPF